MMIGPIDNGPKPPQRPQGQPGSQGQQSQRPQGQSPEQLNMREAQQASQNQKKSRSGFPRWLVIILRILRFFLVPVLLLVALFIGLAIGYSVIGGESASDVFKIDTWKHLYNLVFEGT